LPDATICRRSSPALLFCPAIHVWQLKWNLVVPYSKIPFQAGIYKDDSPLEAKGYWVDADKIRFVRGLPETIYGWERASPSALLGIARGAVTWADNGRNPYAAFGTHLRAYGMDVDGNVTDITPVASRTASQSVSLTTTSGSNTVTAAWSAHGLAASQKFLLESSSVSAVGGITVNGTYIVASVIDANTITFAAAQTATSSAGPTVLTANATVYLAPGQADGLGGLGFGVGGFGSGGYGGSSSGYTLYPRTWSFAPWGQNLVACPRGGGIYEWAPNTSAPELNPDTTMATAWSAGAGWVIAASVATATTSSAALSANMTLPVGAWCLLQFDVTRSAGSLQPSVNGTNQGAAISANGHPFLVFFSGAGGLQSVAFTGASFSGTIANVSLKVLTTLSPIVNAPTVATCIFTTAERILVACGCADVNGNFDALRVRWTDQQNNQTWTAAPANLAGSYTLTNGSRIVRGLSGNRENAVFTDKALYAMRYVPDPNVVYSFTEVADGCGLIGPNAVCQLAGRFFWMSPAGEFFSYDGSYPQPLTCTLQRDINDNLAFSQQDKVYAFPVAGRGEVWWIYPDARDGVECSRYVIYNVGEQSWSVGTFNRTAWTDAGVFEYPLAVDTSGQIWFQEKGFTQDGGPRSWSITSAYFDLGDGDTHMRLVGIQPDAGSLQGGYSIQVGTRIHNGSGVTTRSFGPYSVTSATGKVNARANGQEARLTFSATAAPTFWRLGALRLDLQPAGRRR
jgi:hypothetical protein